MPDTPDYLEEVDGADFSTRDHPSEAFIAAMHARYPTERETEEIFDRKLRRRADPPYRHPPLAELSQRLQAMLETKLNGPFEITDCFWFTGGVSKIQMGFTLTWEPTPGQPRTERLVMRMDPDEGSNCTSRTREFEILQAFEGVIPVPKVYWLDEHATWFQQPALIYAYAPGITKPRATTTGRVSGLGTVFGKELREKLAPQFLRHLAAIHTFDYSGHALPSMDEPQIGTTQSALWQLNRARRIWEEDRGEDVPLVEVAINWLERNLPKLDRTSVVHGDFRSGNFLFDEHTGEINAWLDWERAHLGDRHRDLAWLVQPTMGHYDEDGKTYLVCGLIPLEDFYKRYEDASGLSVDPEKLFFYEVLNGVSIQGSVTASGYRIARLGKSHQDILLARVKGMGPTQMDELAGLLKDRI